MKTIKKIKNTMKLRSLRDEKTRSALTRAGKKSVSGCPELNFLNIEK